MWLGAPSPQSPNEWYNGSWGPPIAFDVNNLNNVSKHFFPQSVSSELSFSIFKQTSQVPYWQEVRPYKLIKHTFFLLKILVVYIPKSRAPVSAKRAVGWTPHTKLHWWNEVIVLEGLHPGIFPVCIVWDVACSVNQYSLFAVCKALWRISR